MGAKKKQAKKSKLEGLILIAIGIASLLLGWLIAFMLWDKIILPFKNDNNIMGPLTLIAFNPLNNIFRFLVFIFLPSLIFTLIYGIHNGFSQFVRSFTRLFNIESFLIQNSRPKALHLMIICLLGILIINLIAHTTNEDLFPMLAPVEKSIQLDLFHDGEFLTPAYNYICGKGVYKGSFFAHGAFYDSLSTVLGWKVFGTVSIGASRQMNFYLTLFLGVTIIFFFVSLYYFLLVLYDSDKSFFYTLLIAILYIVSWNITQYNIRRDAPVFLGLSIILLHLRLLVDGRQIIFIYVTAFWAGVLAPLTMFYSIDKGFYYSAFLIVFFLYIHMVHGQSNRKIRLLSTVAALTGCISTAAIIFVAGGQEEFTAFYDTLSFFSANKDLIDSYVYPKPFSNFKWVGGSTDLPLIIASIGLMIITIKFTRNKLKNPKTFMLILFTVLGVFYFRSGLGRSDYLHVMYASTFLTLILIPLVMDIPYFGKNPGHCLIILCSLLLIFEIASPQARKNIRYALNFKGCINRLVPNRNFINLPDDAFLSPQLQTVRQYLQQKMKAVGQDNIVALSSEAAWPYLLRVPSTSRFFIVLFAMPDKYQDELIEDLKANRPNYLIVHSPHWINTIDNIDIKERLPNVFKFVMSHYVLDKNIYGYEIYRIKLGEL